MSQLSEIEWTDATWNPVVGCSKVSAGCRHCYAERMGRRLAAVSLSMSAAGRNPGRLKHYETVVGDRGDWNGAVATVEEALSDPYRWRKPRRVFVNSMSDLFHPEVPDVFIRRVFKVMNECPTHTFQVLTKRPERAAGLSPSLEWTRNIWMGTSVEDMRVIDRVDALRDTAAATRFLSLEPLLAPLPGLTLEGIGWVIVGGESGPGARPMPASWVREIRDRCQESRVPFFFKQWGGVQKKRHGRTLDSRHWDEMPPTELKTCPTPTKPTSTSTRSRRGSSTRSSAGTSRPT